MGYTRITTGTANSMLDQFVSDFANGTLRVFGGTAPVSASAAETGTLLLQFTLNGGVFTPGVATNGLNFGAASGGQVEKSIGELWRGTVLAAASTGTTATHYRFYANDMTTGSSTTAKRFDGPVVNSQGEYGLYMSDTTLVSGQVREVDSFPVSLPLSITG